MTDSRLIQWCEICDQQTATKRDETYGSWECAHCGQRHMYGEDMHPFLSDEQIALLRAANMAKKASPE